MSDQTPKNRFLESLDRCALSDEFVPSFYKRFLSSSDEIRNKFQTTDFERQNKMLLASLRLTANATAGDPDSLRELGERAESHDRHHLNIRPELYEFWRDSLIATAKGFDEHWDDQTESAWQNSLRYVISHMSRQY
jgi:hemoglobin-like flavoprotein